MLTPPRHGVNRINGPSSKCHGGRSRPTSRSGLTPTPRTASLPRDRRATRPADGAVIMEVGMRRNTLVLMILAITVAAGCSTTGPFGRERLALPVGPSYVGG